MQIKSAEFSIDQAINWIRSGRLAIPDFQRDFIWEPDQICDLLDTVSRQWPIGSLLLLSHPGRELGSRAIAGAPRAPLSKEAIYLLDGQQRITALYQSFADVSDYCFYVDFARLEKGDGEYIRWERREDFERRFGTLELQASAQICKVKTVWQDAEFGEWLSNFSESDRRRKLDRLRSEKLGGLISKRYQLVAVELGSELSLRSLARIFETLNRTGTPLDAFDLLVAVLFPSGFNLKSAWDDSRAAYGSFEYYSVDPIEVLKMASMLLRHRYGRREAQGVRQGDLLSLDPDKLIHIWPKAAEIYDFSLQLGRERFGWFCREAVPNTSLVLGTGAAIESGTCESSLNAWYWLTAFSQYYAQAANTRVVSDFDRFHGGAIEQVFQERASQAALVLQEPAKRNGNALRSLAGLAAINEALDPVSGELLRKQTSIAYRAIGNDGALRRLADLDGLDCVLFLSKSSDRKLASAELTRPSQFRMALETQGFLNGNSRRSLSWILDELRKHTYGAW